MFNIYFMIREATMGVQSPDGECTADFIDLLAIGFGTTVAMWAVGYFGLMPLTRVPPAVVLGLMLFCPVVGGWTVGRKTRRGVLGGLGLGLIVALLNLQILGSLLVDPNTRVLVPQAGIWVLGYILVSLALPSVGTVAGMAFRISR